MMTTLHNTEPHFIRCIVPNTHKQPLMVEPELIMHQLTCNGVLEGIRICMRGFPNRMPYPEFLYRFANCLQIKSNFIKKLTIPRDPINKFDFIRPLGTIRSKCAPQNNGCDGFKIVQNATVPPPPPAPPLLPTTNHN